MSPDMPETNAVTEVLPTTLPGGTLLAFDFGEKRIGVAVGESALTQAHPLTTIRSALNAERFAAIAALIAEWQPTGLVVGLPLTLDGKTHAMTARCRRFAKQLRKRFSLPVVYAEERFSSIEAEERLHASGHNSRSARAHLDAVAAQIILQNYFAQQDTSSNAGGSAHPSPASPLSHSDNHAAHAD